MIAGETGRGAEDVAGTVDRKALGLTEEGMKESRLIAEPASRRWGVSQDRCIWEVQEIAGRGWR